jgi:hypothetical protein
MLAQVLSWLVRPPLLSGERGESMLGQVLSWLVSALYAPPYYQEREHTSRTRAPGTRDPEPGTRKARTWLIIARPPSRQMGA